MRNAFRSLFSVWVIGMIFMSLVIRYFTGQFISGLEYEKKIHEFCTKMVDN